MTACYHKLVKVQITPASKLGLSFQHNRDCVVDGTTYPKTGAAFPSILAQIAGLLMARGKRNPEYQIAEMRRMEGKVKVEISVPGLRKWSDIAFIQWKVLAGVAIVDSGLRCVVQANVQNADTVAVMSKVFGKDATGTIITEGFNTLDRPDSEGAQALLGTLNGCGIDWLLIQHKLMDKLGHKVVETVTMFFSEPNLLFHIKDVSPKRPLS
jgi:hypothetical protein